MKMVLPSPIDLGIFITTLRRRGALLDTYLALQFRYAFWKPGSQVLPCQPYSCFIAVYLYPLSQLIRTNIQT